jgi:hypothetical protein
MIAELKRRVARLDKRTAIAWFVRWLLTVATIFGPPVGVYALLRGTMRVSPTKFTPVWWDEIENFSSTATFSRAGFRGGYFTAIEDPAPATFAHFSTHGPTFPLIQGLWGKVLGWRYDSGPFFNAAVVSLAIAGFIWVVRPNIAQLVVSAAVFISFWPFYEFIPSNMQEPLHFAIGILFGAAFYVAYYRPRRLTRGLRFGLFAAILAAALIRSSWALLFVPYFLLGVRKRPLPVLIALAKAGVGIVVSLWLWRYLCAPYRNIETAYLMIKVVTAETKMQTLFTNFNRNVAQLEAPSKSFGPLAIPGIAQTMALIPIILVFLLWRLYRRQSIKVEAFHIFNLGSIVGSTLVFYFVVAGAPRVFPLHLLVTLALLIASKRRAYLALVGAVAVSNVVPYKTELKQFPIVHAAHYSDATRAMTTVFRKDVGDVLVYRPNKDAWCNTVLTGLGTYNSWYAALPPGLGLSAYQRPAEMTEMVRSHYIIADPRSIQQLRVKPVLVKKLTLPPGQNLYVNADADRRCD